MVEEEKLLEWVREKLEQGVDEQRIRKSLKETGHDPALLEKAKDPFHKSGEQDGNLDTESVQGENKEESVSEQSGQGHDPSISQPTRNVENTQDDLNNSKAENSGNRDKEARNNLRNHKESKKQRSNQDAGREPSIDLSSGSSERKNGRRQQKDNSPKNQSNRRDLENNRNQKQTPQENMQREQRNQRQMSHQRQPDQQSKDEGRPLNSFSFPSLSLPSFSLNFGKPSIPRKYVAGLIILLIIGGAGFGIHTSGILQNAEAPSLPLGDSSDSTDSNTQEAFQTQSNEGCPDVGVRIENVYRTDSGITADLKLFGGEILAVAELMDGGNLVESKEITISNKKTVNFNSEGSEVVFRPYDCNRIKDSYQVS